MESECQLCANNGFSKFTCDTSSSLFKQNVKILKICFHRLYINQQAVVCKETTNTLKFHNTRVSEWKEISFKIYKICF